MSHLPLDARAILSYLNELGYRNITAEQLKEFMKDLRKLIKYEERLGANAHQDDHFESLFRRTTASYRAKADKENVDKAKSKAATTTTALKESGAEKQQQLDKNMTKKLKQQKKVKTAAANGTVAEGEATSWDSAKQQNERQVLGENNRPDSQRNGNKANGAKSISFDDMWDAIKLDSGKSTATPNNAATYRVNQTNKKGKKAMSAQAAAVVAMDVDEEEEEEELIEELPLTSQERTARSRSDQMRSTGTASGIRRRMQEVANVPHWERQSGTSRAHSSSRGTMVALPRSKKPTDRSGIHDPVALYHYYQREWKHFQKQIPGENSRSDLRWQVRQQLLDPK